MQQQHILAEQIICLLIGKSPTSHHIRGSEVLFLHWVAHTLAWFPELGLLLAIDTLCLCCSLRAGRLSWMPRSSRAWRHQRGRA